VKILKKGTRVRLTATPPGCECMQPYKTWKSYLGTVVDIDRRFPTTPYIVTLDNALRWGIAFWCPASILEIV
jgi:hypothetical protein